MVRKTPVWIDQSTHSRTEVNTEKEVQNPHHKTPVSDKNDSDGEKIMHHLSLLSGGKEKQENQSPHHTNLVSDSIHGDEEETSNFSSDSNGDVQSVVRYNEEIFDKVSATARIYTTSRNMIHHPTRKVCPSKKSIHAANLNEHVQFEADDRADQETRMDSNEVRDDRIGVTDLVTNKARMAVDNLHVSQPKKHEIAPTEMFPGPVVTIEEGNTLYKSVNSDDKEKVSNSNNRAQSLNQSNSQPNKPGELNANRDFRQPSIVWRRIDEVIGALLQLADLRGDFSKTNMVVGIDNVINDIGGRSKWKEHSIIDAIEKLSPESLYSKQCTELKPDSVVQDCGPIDLKEKLPPNKDYLVGSVDEMCTQTDVIANEKILSERLCAKPSTGVKRDTRVESCDPKIDTASAPLNQRDARRGMEKSDQAHIPLAPSLQGRYVDDVVWKHKRLEREMVNANDEENKCAGIEASFAVLEAVPQHSINQLTTLRIDTNLEEEKSLVESWSNDMDIAPQIEPSPSSYSIGPDDLHIGLRRLMSLQKKDEIRSTDDNSDEEIFAFLARLGHLKAGGHLPDLRAINLEDISFNDNEIEVDQEYGVVYREPYLSNTMKKPLSHKRMTEGERRLCSVLQSKASLMNKLSMVDSPDQNFSSEGSGRQSDRSRRSMATVLSPKQIQKRERSANEQWFHETRSFHSLFFIVVKSMTCLSRSTSGSERKMGRKKKITHQWKLSLEERTKDHPGFLGADVQFLRESTAINTASNELDIVPWDCEDSLHRPLKNGSNNLTTSNFVEVISVGGNTFCWGDEPSQKTSLTAEIPKVLQPWKYFRKKDVEEVIEQIMEPHKNIYTLVQGNPIKEKDTIYAEDSISLHSKLISEDEGEQSDKMDVVTLLNTKIQV